MCMFLATLLRTSSPQEPSQPSMRTFNALSRWQLVTNVDAGAAVATWPVHEPAIAGAPQAPVGCESSTALGGSTGGGEVGW